MLNRLKDKVAVVTGASGGIGQAISVGLAMEGARLCITGRDQIRLGETEALCHPFGKADVLACDLTNDADLAYFADHVGERFGRVDVLVHCAGIHIAGSVTQPGAKSLDAQYAANVRAPIVLTRALLPLIKGHIVFINSSAVLSVKPGRGAFSATQHALKCLADTLRQESGVRVTSIYPGRTATPRIKDLCWEEGKAYQPDTLLQPEDVAAAVVYAVTQTAEVTDISLRSRDGGLDLVPGDGYR